MARKAAAPVEPKITRIKGLQVVNINGEDTLVEEIVYVDWGPKLGVSTGYVLPPKPGHNVNLDALDRILGKYGRKIDREASKRAWEEANRASALA